jgi:hypothetical protein
MNCLMPASRARKRTARWWNARTPGTIGAIAGAAPSIDNAALRSASKLSRPPFRKSATRAALGVTVSIRSAFARRVASSCQSSIILPPSVVSGGTLSRQR